MRRQGSVGATKQTVAQTAMKIQDEDKTQNQLPLDIFRLFAIRDQELHRPNNPAAFYHMFTCPICKSLLKQPVVLPCSHRFCRSCLDHHAKKLGDNKLCLVCRIAVKTKKDIKDDKSIEMMIQAIYGNVDTFRMEICRAESKQVDRQKQQQEKRKETAGVRSVKKKKQGETQQTLQSIKVETPAEIKKLIKKIIAQEPPMLRPDLMISEPHHVASPIIIDDDADTKATEICQLIQKKHDIQPGNLYKVLQEDLGVLLCIKLKKTPDDQFTRQIEKNGLQTLTKTTLYQVKIHLCRCLRLDEKQQIFLIKLYRVAQQRRKSEGVEGVIETQKYLMQLTDDRMTLGQVNQKFWHNVRSDYSVYSIQDMMEAIRQKIKPHVPSERVIYYKVDYSQIKTNM